MGSKIEKFVGDDSCTPRDFDTYRYINNLQDKVNEIIDHLNSQSQPEERYAYTYKETPEGTIEHKIKLDPKPQDTPEEWEGRLTTGSLGESEYFRIDGEYVDDKETMVRFIKQLLDEREREVRKQERMIRLHKRVS